MAPIGPDDAGTPAETKAETDMARQVSVIITTSPTPSAPSTDLLSAVLASFHAHCPDLLRCPVFVVFDAYDHIEPRARLKRGCVTAEEAACYETYKDNVKALIMAEWERSLSSSDAIATKRKATGEAEYGSPFIADNAVPFSVTRNGPVAFIEPVARLGFALAVRTALREAATPYVWVQQHDWTLVADIPLQVMVEAMDSGCEVTKKGMVDQVEGLDNKAREWEEQAVEREQDKDEDDNEDGDEDEAEDENEDEEKLGIPVRYICLPSVRMLRYATSGHVIRFPTLRSVTIAHKRSDATLPLTPLFFWHDKTHLASRAHYLARVFPSRLSVGRGDFIEDHIGQRARTQMKQDPAAFRKWACWLYYPENGNQLCLKHLQGRTWRGEDHERALRDLYRERNQTAASAAAEAAKLAAAAAKAAEATRTISETWDRNLLVAGDAEGLYDENTTP